MYSLLLVIVQNEIAVFNDDFKLFVDEANLELLRTSSSRTKISHVVSVCDRVYDCVCMYVYVYDCVCMYVCICVRAC